MQEYGTAKVPALTSDIADGNRTAWPPLTKKLGFHFSLSARLKLVTMGSANPGRECWPCGWIGECP
jgi:hypothetical protein